MPLPEPDNPARGHLVHGHLVHGMGKELESPAWPVITRAEAEAVLAHYPQAGKVMALPWHSPRPFSAAALVKAAGGEFILKRHHRSLRLPLDLTQEHGFIAHLRRAGVEASEVMQAQGGATAIGQGEWTYELHRVSPGIDLYRDRPSWTGFLTHGHAHAAGAALGRLHRAASDYAAPPRRACPLLASLTILPARDPLAAAQDHIAARPALARFLQDRAWRDELGRIFSLFGRGLAERLAVLAPVWTHNDWHPSNMLWTPDGQVASVFDFGLATRTCAMHDLATAIERCAIAWLDLQDGAAMEGDAAAALALVEGYRTVAPMTQTDFETMVDLLPLVHIEFALSEVDYFAGILKDDAQAVIAWDDYLIGHARWFAGHEGQAFLKDLRRGGVG